MMNKNKPILLFTIIFLIILAMSFLYLLVKEKSSNETILETYRKLDSNFGVGITHLSLTSAEGDFSRGGYVRGEGTDQNGNIIKFYHDWGWCSSGGAGCGFVFCFSAPTLKKNIHYYVEVNNPEPNYVYELMNKNLCRGDMYSWSSSIEADCKSGKFEEVMSGRIIFSLAYSDEGEFTKGPNIC